ncbi:MAG TPA: Mu-like prophage major head subunit gpT family protein [Polyangiaceae bacterium]|nr:Mu-like prophage major head subunit gpT family protein [Polyangiaceae bacterium]
MDPTPENLADLRVGYNMRFNQAMAEVKQWWQIVASEAPSTTLEEAYPWLELLPDMREWVDERVVHHLAARFQKLKNKPYELTIDADLESVEDDRYGIFANRVAMMGRSVGNLWNRITVDAMKGALTAVVYDGQFFIDTDHPVDPDSPGLGVQSNKITTALSLTSFRAARTAMKSFKGSNGISLQIEPNLLVVPPALEDVAREIVEADLVEKNGAGVSNISKGNVDVLVVHELAEISNTNWQLLDTTKPSKPYLVQKRKEPETTMLTKPTDPNVFWKRLLIYGAYARGAGGYGMWQTAYYSTGTT